MFEVLLLLLLVMVDEVRHLAVCRRTNRRRVQLLAVGRLARGRGAADWRHRLALLLGRGRVGEQTLQVGRVLVDTRGRGGRHRGRKLLLLLKDELLELGAGRLVSGRAEERKSRPAHHG